MKYKFVAILFLTQIITLGFGELPVNLSQLLPSSALKILQEKGELYSLFKDGQKPDFFPQDHLGKELNNILAKLKPNFGAVACILHKKLNANLSDSASLRQIGQTLFNISSLKGLYYYSASRKRMRELFIDIYRITSQTDKKRLPDPVIKDSIPALEKIFIYQHDSSFGENIFQVSYRFENKTFLVQMENLTTIYYGILPLVDPGKLVYLIYIYPEGEYLLFYSIICVKGANPFGILESRAASFFNRIKALDSWFISKVGLF